MRIQLLLDYSSVNSIIRLLILLGVERELLTIASDGFSDGPYVIGG